MTRDDFLKSSIQRRYGTVKLPVSGMEVRVQSLTELERTKYERAIWDSNGKRISARVNDSKARLICLCLVDDDGRKLLDETDVDQVMALDAADTGFLFDFLFRFLGFDQSDLEAIAKN